MRTGALLSLAAESRNGGAAIPQPVPQLNQFLTEEELGECVRDACVKLGWRFLWLRKTYNSSAGILDLQLIPIRLPQGRTVSNIGGANRELLGQGNRHILHRELKGYNSRGGLGKPTGEQLATIDDINAAGGDAAVWTPEDWFSGRIAEELR